MWRGVVPFFALLCLLGCASACAVLPFLRVVTVLVGLGASLSRYTQKKQTFVELNTLKVSPRYQLGAITIRYGANTFQEQEHEREEHVNEAG